MKTYKINDNAQTAAEKFIGAKIDKSQHTPTPWNQIAGNICEGSAIVAHNAHHEHIKVALNVRHEDASFICRAVNAHESLMRVVTQLQWVLNQDWNPESDIGPLDTLFEFKDEVDKAIAKGDEI